MKLAHIHRLTFLFCALIYVAQAQAPGGKCPNALTLNDYKIPYCRNRPLNTDYQNITHAVIVQHGNNRNALQYFESAVAAGDIAGVLNYTTIVAPQFITEEDRQAYGVGSEYLTWTSAQWKKGGDASIGTKTSSFEWHDHLVETLVQTHKYALQHISVVGFSAGGQFVQRYAGVSKGYDYAAAQNVTMSFVVMSASSYMWLDGTRPVNSPQPCDGFNEYKYGLEERGEYSYFNTASDDEIRFNHAIRPIYTGVGELDLGGDDACEAVLQGATRKDRAENYSKERKKWCVDIMESQLGGDQSAQENAEEVCEELKKQRYGLTIIPGVGHDFDAAFHKSAGTFMLFNR